MIDPCHKCTELCELDLHFIIVFLLGIYIGTLIDIRRAMEKHKDELNDE